ncbi:MAG TPA: hypothetical protein VJ724_02935 [Tahibacter sp.]|nr:hypothetical protein [Tahibacter sp.]
MTSSASPLFAREIVNGGEVLIPLDLSVDNIEQMGLVDGAPGLATYTRASLPRALGHVSRDPHNLMLSLVGGGGPRSRPWQHLILLRRSGHWQRVHLETLTCGVCGWRGLTANPALNELYFGTINEMDELSKALDIAPLPCPRCNSKLPRQAIWIDPKAVQV